MVKVIIKHIGVVLVLSLIVLIISCTEQKKVTLESTFVPVVLNVKDDNIQKNKNASDVIEIDSLVVLETCDKSLIGRISRLFVTDAYIYILDRYVSNSLYCFDKSGKYINSFCCIGKGPNEYLQLKDFSYIENKLFVSASPHRLFELDIKLNLIKNHKINWGGFFNEADALLAKNKDTLIFWSSLCENKFNFYDLKNNRFFAHLPSAIGVDNGSPVEPLHIGNENKILCQLDLFDTIYILEPDRLIPKYIIDFENPIPLKKQIELKAMNFIDRRGMIESNMMHNISRFNEGEDFISFFFVYQRRWNYYFYNKMNSKSIVFQHNINNDLFKSSFFPFPLGYYKNSVVCSVDAIDLIKNDGKQKVKVPKEIKEDSNPVLMFYHPKF